MFYIIGDIHGHFQDVTRFIYNNNLTEDDCIILLGDVGFNFYGQDKGDYKSKKKVNNAGVKLLCIQGNHECRPQNLSSYKEKIWNEGTVFVESEFPNIMFAKDGEIYNLDGKKALVLGGAYSVDKYYRLVRCLLNQLYSPVPQEDLTEFIYFVQHNIGGKKVMKKMDKILNKMNSFDLKWWKDEQISDEDKENIEDNLNKTNWNVDYIFSHTCPAKYIPTEAFLPGINQDIVDNSMEQWLDKIEEKISYNKWYCGHWHIEKIIDKIEFMYNNQKELR